MHTFLKAIIVLGGVTTMGSASHGAALLLDFGPTAIGSAATVSPYHAVSGSTETVWNTTLGVDDIVAGALKWSDNTTATGVSINLGVGNATSSTLATAPTSSSALGTAIATNLYGSTTSSARDGIFTNTSGQAAITMQVAGLPAGQYAIYYIGRNTNRGVSDNYTQTMYAAASSSTGDFNYSGYSADVITYGTTASNSNITTWVLGQNYAKLNVTLTSGQNLNLAFIGAGVEGRGFVNALQIAPVPEPATTGLALLGAIGLASRRRRAAR